MKRSIFFPLALLFLVAFLLVGCGTVQTGQRPGGQRDLSAVPGTPFRSSRPSSTPAASDTDLATPAETTTPAPTFTATLVPAEEAEPSPTPSPTATAVPSPALDAESATAEAELPLEELEVKPEPALEGMSLQGRLVFQEASGGNIYLINADGTGLRLLTQGMDPALSPDGEAMAFVRWDKDKGIYLMDLASGEVQMIKGGEVAKSPVWSPDGSTIAFTSSYIGLVPPKGPMRGGRFGGRMGEPKEEERWSLHTLNVWDGSTFDPRCDWYSFSPSWGPNGQTLVYDGTEGLRLVTVDEEPRFLFAAEWDPTSPTEAIFDQSPAWSPDGSRIAYMYEQHDHWEIYTVRPDGSDRQRLTKEPLFTDDAPNNVAPAWSPDGQHIVFLSDRNGEWELFVMDADGSNERKMFETELEGVNFQYDFATERVVSWSW